VPPTVRTNKQDNRKIDRKKKKSLRCFRGKGEDLDAGKKMVAPCVVVIHFPKVPRGNGLRTQVSKKKGGGSWPSNENKEWTTGTPDPRNQGGRQRRRPAHSTNKSKTQGWKEGVMGRSVSPGFMQGGYWELAGRLKATLYGKGKKNWRSLTTTPSMKGRNAIPSGGRFR